MTRLLDPFSTETSTRRAYFGNESMYGIGSCHRDRLGRWVEVTAVSGPRVCRISGLRFVEVTLKRI